jgi:hypothetical protein
MKRLSILGVESTLVLRKFHLLFYISCDSLARTQEDAAAIRSRVERFV